MPYVTAEVEVFVDPQDLSDDDLLDELRRRNLEIHVDREDDHELMELVESIYQLRRQAKDYGSRLDQLIYLVIGRM